MPKFIDFHPNRQLKPETVGRRREDVRTGRVDEFGVRQLESCYSPDGTGAYCLLEGPDEEAVRKHHGGRCGDPLRVEALL